jgi:hypothetical protein
MQELFRLFPEFIDRLKDNEQAVAAFVFASWRMIAGEALRERTAPLAFTQKRLTLAVENETWKRHLEGLSGDMLFRLNAVLGQGVVSFIEFRADEAAVSKSEQTEQGRAKTAAVAKPVPRSIKKAAGAIADESLRGQFLGAASAYLTGRNR